MANPILTSLTAYVDELSFNFIQECVFGGTTTKHATFVSGYGNSYKLPYIDHSLVLEANTCDITSGQSQSTYAQASITLCDLVVQKDECLKDLFAYFTNVYQPKARREAKQDIPTAYAEYYMATYMKNLEYAIDYAIWNGNNDCLKGLWYDITNTYQSSMVVVTGSTLTTSNILAEVNEMVAGVTCFGKPMTLFMSPSNYTLYKQALVAANYVNYALPAQNGGEEGIMVPGFEWIMAVPANLGTNDKMLLIAEDNLFIGTSAEAELTKITGEYINYNNRFRTSAEFNLGVSIAFPSQAIYWYKV